MVDLCNTSLEHMQNYLGIFGIVLVPGVVEYLSSPGNTDRWDKTNIVITALQEITNRSVVVARRFDPNDMIWVLGKKSVKLPVVGHFIVYDELLALPIRKLHKNVVFYFRNINRQI